jgi:hypothetical protein
MKLPVDESTDTHGTACASIIGASSNNDCAVGIAPGATISACVAPGDDDEEEARMFVTNLDSVDISSNSWGPDICLSPYIESRRRLQQCPFSPDNFDSPCEVCGNFAGELSEECREAISLYCISHYEVDPVACKYRFC